MYELLNLRAWGASLCFVCCFSLGSVCVHSASSISVCVILLTVQSVCCCMNGECVSFTGRLVSEAEIVRLDKDGIQDKPKQTHTVQRDMRTHTHMHKHTSIPP